MSAWSSLWHVPSCCDTRQQKPGNLILVWTQWGGTNKHAGRAMNALVLSQQSSSRLAGVRQPSRGGSFWLLLTQGQSPKLLAGGEHLGVWANTPNNTSSPCFCFICQPAQFCREMPKFRHIPLQKSQSKQRCPSATRIKSLPVSKSTLINANVPCN